MLSRHLLRCLAMASCLILAGNCFAQVPQSPDPGGDGQQVQPQGDSATLPSNPFSDNDQDASPPEETAPPDDNPADATPPEDQAQPAPVTSAPQPAPTASSGIPASPAPSTMQPSRALPSSLMDKPAQPAKVTLIGGELAVHANNSSLSQILHQLASTSGMKIDGMAQDQRVFGSYGPGDPRDVLSSLLAGANYNVLMVGSSQGGAPRELILTPRGNAPAASPQNTISIQPDDQQDDQSADDNPQPQFVAPPRMPMPQPQQSPNGTVKTPQQILKELEQLRQQQQQRQPPQQ
jgi:hypothetical protein